MTSVIKITNNLLTDNVHLLQMAYASDIGQKQT